jgi:hypothetical protein
MMEQDEIRALQQYFETQDLALSALKDLVIHTQEGIEKCFERIEKIETYLKKEIS